MQAETSQRERVNPWGRYLSDLRRRYPGRPGPGPDGRDAEESGPSEEERVEVLLTHLPPEIGALLIVIGVAGLLLPGPVGSPFVVAGGVVLWPRAFGRVDRWFAARCPRMHRQGMTQIGRFLDDLERRYPGSAGPAEG